MSKTTFIVTAVAAVGIGLGVLLSGSSSSLIGLPGLPGTAQAQEKIPEKARDGTAKSPAGDARPRSEKKKKKRKKRTTLVHVDRVKDVPMVQTLPLVGRLVATRSGDVASRIDAPVAEMRVDIGDSVHKGDVLATLVNDRLKWDREQKAAELTAAKAAVSTAKARLALARQELKRFEELQTSAAFSKARYEDKRLEVARLRTEILEAQAKVERARAVLKLADTEIAYTRILAPYDGTITRRQTEVGSYVKEGQAVYTMVSDKDLEVEVDVPASRIGALHPGTVAQFQLGNIKTRYQATVRAIVPQEDLRTRTRTVRLKPRFGSRPAAVAANQSATVYIPLGEGRKVLSVHKDAIVMVQGSPTAYVVVDGRAEARRVKLGESVGERFEVVDGLKQGDLVVTRGNERLRDGERVRYNGVATQ